MILDRRVLFKNNTALNDISMKVTGVKADGSLFDYVAGEDYLYVGAVLPFNHLYFDLSVVNAVSTAVTVEFWDGMAWVEMVDVMDETVALSKSGKISWTVPRDRSWIYELDSYDVTGLETTVIYQMYWARISFGANLTGTTAISMIGQKYCDEDYLFALYPDLNQTQLFEQYEVGKTTWDDQIVIASDMIRSYLRNKGIIKSGDQILKPDLLQDACAHKTAELIMAAFGTAYNDNKAAAKKEFEGSINMRFFAVDLNRDTILSTAERNASSGTLTR